jgi:hypothetical protein
MYIIEVNTEKEIPMSEYHYIQSEPGLWTVGTGTPGKGGNWEPESDHESPEAAAERVRYLNGGYGTSKDAAYITNLERRVNQLEGLLEKVPAILHRGLQFVYAHVPPPDEHVLAVDMDSLRIKIEDALEPVVEDAEYAND